MLSRRVKESCDPRGLFDHPSIDLVGLALFCQFVIFTRFTEGQPRQVDDGNHHDDDRNVIGKGKNVQKVLHGGHITVLPSFVKNPRGLQTALPP